MSMHECDIVIVGAGVVGQTLACALRDVPVKIAVVDAAHPPVRQDMRYQLRVSSITRGTQRVLDELGVWQWIPPERLGPYRYIDMWMHERNGCLHFDAAEYDQPWLGYIVENVTLLEALTQQLQSCEQVAWFIPQRCRQLECEQGVAIELESGDTIKARLCVGADGGRSWVRKQAGIELTAWDYDQHAVVTTAKTEHPHRQSVWQRFLSTGPLAFLPLHEPDYSSVVWSTSPDEAQRLLSLNDAEFKKELTIAFDAHLGRVTDVAPRASFPLRMQHAKTYVREGIALIGDSAHTMHPLAGQGLNKGLLDAHALATVIKQHLTDFEALAVLKQYQRMRRANNMEMIAFLEGMKRIYSSPIGWVKSMASFGLNLTDRVTPLKSMFAKWIQL